MSGTMPASTSLVLILISVLELSPATAGCPTGWNVFHSRCYALISQLLTYAEAMHICNNFGAEIVEINSEEENSFILSILESKSVGKVWIGINDLFHEGTWVLGSNGTPVPYTKWISNQPDNYQGIEDCGTFITHHKGWNDDHCGNRFWFFCESR